MTEPTTRGDLPWFSFFIKPYVSDTLRLTTEGHGAYLLLMLDYYQSGEPPPDDDFILAAITKLPMEAWERHRKVLARFFDIREGHWFHERIETEIAEASRRVATSKLRAEAGGAARAKQIAAEREKQGKTPAKPPRSAQGNLQGKPQASSEVSSKQPHLTLNKENSLSTAAPPEIDLEDEEPIGSPIPPNWRPRDATVIACLEEATQEEFEREVTTFVNRNLAEGGFMNDWNAAFGTWWIRFKDHRAKERERAAKKAPARIEVNKSPEEAAEAMAASFEGALKIFAKGMQWPRGMGPEPGQLGCKIDPDLIRKHGLDPKTGMKLREPAS